MRSLVCVLLVPLLAACAVTGGEQEWVDQPYAFPDAPGVVYLESFGSVMDVDPPSAFEKFVIGEDIYKGNQVITNPWGIATTRGKVYINDGFGNSAYFEYDLETRKLKAFPDPLLAGSSGIAVDSAGNKYVAVPRLVEAKAKGTFGTAEETGRVVVFDKRNRRTTVLDIPGRPVDVAVGDDKLFVSNLVRNNITVLDLKTLEITGAFGQNGPEGTELRGPRGIAVGGDGRVYVGDMFAGRVKVFEQDGTYVAQYGYRARFVGGFMAITGVDADKEGVVYAVDSMASLKGTHDDVQILKSWE
ncbi:MAG: hypothetical protein GWO16_15030, partial [Gammaproteobacteria bacterium]|nr:hypothetical protein [Gammaproteobacteria bacterium]NIR99269.1 hypothetical protein [Gammaproteobacteria bacterium]NIT64885.1 hypothetical protein [Gammaproteobacteria bacterium]NIV21837.1 hypothetical protein [Gammaproteobacteria bacterium]NIY33465.1 hypothetical protein [Gammaproteobacteria bacterium]